MCFLLALTIGIILFIILLNRKSLGFSIASFSGTMFGTIGIIVFVFFFFFQCVNN